MTTLDWAAGAGLTSSSFPGSCDIFEPKFLEQAPTHCHLALTELIAIYNSHQEAFRRGWVLIDQEAQLLFH